MCAPKIIAGGRGVGGENEWRCTARNSRGMPGVLHKKFTVYFNDDYSDGKCIATKVEW